MHDVPAARPIVRARRGDDVLVLDVVLVEIDVAERHLGGTVVPVVSDLSAIGDDARHASLAIALRRPVVHGRSNYLRIA
ncbi:MAG: hypothetical protein ACYCV5_07450 [Acidimicrobiales bacterium]